MWAYALAGTLDIDLYNDPLGTDKNGNPVYLNDIWPSQQEVLDVIQNTIDADMYDKHYSGVFDGNPTWNDIPNIESQVYPWDDSSTYIQEPPFFTKLTGRNTRN